MNTLSTGTESSNTLSSIINAISTACSELVDAFTLTFDKVSEYSMKTAQGVFGGVKSLFVDVIVMKLRQIATLMHELKSTRHQHGFQPAYIDSLIDLQKNQMMMKMDRHNFFKQNF